MNHFLSVILWKLATEAFNLSKWIYTTKAKWKIDEVSVHMNQYIFIATSTICRWIIGIYRPFVIILFGCLWVCNTYECIQCSYYTNVIVSRRSIHRYNSDIVCNRAASEKMAWIFLWRKKNRKKSKLYTFSGFKVTNRFVPMHFSIGSYMFILIYEIILLLFKFWIRISMNRIQWPIPDIAVFVNFFSLSVLLHSTTHEHIIDGYPISKV